MSNISEPIFLPAFENNSDEQTGQNSDEENEEKSEESEPESCIEKIKEKLPQKKKVKTGFSRMKNFACAIRGNFVASFFIH